MLARIVRAAPAEFRRVLESADNAHPLHVAARRTYDILDVWEIFDDAGHHLATLTGDNGRLDTWYFHIGDERIELADTDYDGIADSRRREIYEPGGELLKEESWARWRDGRWVVREMDDLRTCPSTGNYRHVRFLGHGRQEVTYHSCVTS